MPYSHIRLELEIVNNIDIHCFVLAIKITIICLGHLNPYSDTNLN
jgi:hypothetical protein